jgi:hypothetical protein
LAGKQELEKKPSKYRVEIGHDKVVDVPND